MPKVSAQAARIAKKGSEMFRVFFCVSVCNSSRFEGFFSSCARDFLPRLAGAPPRRVVPAASYWRAAAVTRAPALLLFRRKYRLRRKVFLCRRAVLSPPRRVIPAMPFPPQLAGQSLRAIFPAARCAAGKIIFRKILSFRKKSGNRGAICPPEKFQTARRGRFFSKNFVLWEKTGNRGASCPPKKC